MATEAKKAVIKSGDMADSMQQDAIDSATAVSYCAKNWSGMTVHLRASCLFFGNTVALQLH